MIFTKIKSAIYKVFSCEEPERLNRANSGDDLSLLDSSEVFKLRKPELFFPRAFDCTKDTKTRGYYPNKYPSGAVIHYTASHGSLEREVSYAKKNGYSYFLIDRSGVVAQLAPLNRWGYHAGKSSWEGLGSNVSRYLVGIEVVCGGLLTEKIIEGKKTYRTWWGKEVDSSNMRRDGLSGVPYEIFNNKQEEALLYLILWLKENNPDVFNFDYVLGHHEVSPGRKVDPGESISFSMPAYREFLKEEYKEGVGSIWDYVKGNLV